MFWYCWNQAFGPWNMIGGFIMMIFGLLFLALIIYLAFQLLAKNNGITKLSITKSPEDLLKERYAKGEISKEKYEEMLHDLRK